MTDPVTISADGTVTPPASVTAPSPATTTPSTPPATTTTPTTTPPPATPSTPATESPSLLNSGEKPDAAAATGAPEKYNDYKVPDGYSLDGETKTAADAIFKEFNLSQDQAQKLVDFYITKTQDAFKAPFEAWDKMNKEWREEAAAHPDLRGKLGPGQEVNVRVAKALASIPDRGLVSDFMKLMDSTGAGNHQAFIRVLDHFAKQVTEGTPVRGNGPTTAGQSAPGASQRSLAQTMYPNNPSSS